jgi:hypothetical protein
MWVPVGSKTHKKPTVFFKRLGLSSKHNNCIQWINLKKAFFVIYGTAKKFL